MRISLSITSEDSACGSRTRDTMHVRRTPYQLGQLPRSIKYRHGRHGKVLQYGDGKMNARSGQLTVPSCEGWMTCDIGRDHFTPCYMYTCNRFFAHALTDRLRHGAIKRFDARTESRLMRGSNLHYR